MSKITVLISITPTQDDIVGVIGNEIHIRGSYIPDDDNPLSEYHFKDEPPCVIKVERSLYFELLNKWMDTKKNYCERDNTYCGVFGSFHAEEVIQEGFTTLLTGWEDSEKDEGSPIYEKVPVFNVLKFDEHCDMEHG